MLFLYVLVGLLPGLASAYHPAAKLKIRDTRNGNTSVARYAGPEYPAHYIDMPIDHFPDSPRYAPHTNATFKQRYFFDSSYYKPGGPVYLYIGGETAAENRFSNLRTGIIQILMQASDGLGVILENRYYGKSYPFDTSTTDELAYLTTEQTIADNAYFARHATFPGMSISNLNAPGTPWILYGGSLAGGQTAFSVRTYGDLLFGGIASSSAIKAFHAYHQWYTPIQKFGPSDCIASINQIVDKFDGLIGANMTLAVQQFKEIFGLGALTDDRDFARTIAFPIGGPLTYPTKTWQELNWNSIYGSNDFWDFCTNVTNLYAPEIITSVDYALSNFTDGKPWTNLGNYANYVQKYVNTLCPEPSLLGTTACFGTQNQTYWADTTNSVERSLLYTVCTELGVYQVAPPSGPSLISRVLQVDHTQQWCMWAFPNGTYNSIPSTGPDLSYYDSYGGFALSAERLAFIDGDQDVWLDVGPHSRFAAEREPSSDLHPRLLIAGAGHHWDSYGILDIAAEPQFIRNAHLWEIRAVTKWLRTFSSWEPGNAAAARYSKLDLMLQNPLPA